MWQVGYGAINPAAVIPWNVSGTGGILLTVLVANSPQAVLSFLSLNYNGMITCMLMAKEWHGYAKERKLAYNGHHIDYRSLTDTVYLC